MTGKPTERERWEVISGRQYLDLGDASEEVIVHVSGYGEKQHAPVICQVHGSTDDEALSRARQIVTAHNHWEEMVELLDNVRHRYADVDDLLARIEGESDQDR